jgi:hypothetical protein
MRCGRACKHNVKPARTAKADAETPCHVVVFAHDLRDLGIVPERLCSSGA